MSVETQAAFDAAFAHHQAGRTDAAELGYRAILADDPDHTDSLHLLGLLLVQADPVAGEALILRAIALVPGSAPHHNSLGLVLRALGRDVEAVGAFEAATVLRPESAEVRNNLATTLRDLGRTADAIAEYRRAAAHGPGLAEIWYNLGSTLAEASGSLDVDEPGSAGEAEACFRRAIALQPGMADALANFGRFLIGQSRWAEAAAWLSEAVTLSPADASGWTNLGVACQELGDSRAAEVSYRRAARIDPGNADAAYNLGCLLAGEGRNEEALTSHAAAVAADPAHGAARLAQCTACLPILYRSEIEAQHWRSRYLAALDDLARAVETPAVARAVAAAIGTSQPFFLPYQGQDDTVPQATLGRLLCRVAARDDDPTPLAAPPGAGERIRLGIVSGFFQDHTIFKLFLEGLLPHLDRDRFEVFGFHTGRAVDARTARCAEWSDHFVNGPTNIAAWRKAIVSSAPHILLYPEVGLDPMCGALAARRLAPVQCVAWGHPETTGMPTIDHFLSSELMEPPDGAAHYTEHLQVLPNLGVYYVPEPVSPPLDRAALGLTPDVPVYWSGQALYKYAPAYDMVFPRIAAAVGPCQFVFIEFAKSRAVTAVFRDRLASAFAAFGLDAERYCVMLPPMSRERFLAAVGAADVVLDTPCWSGGKSSLDCLSQDQAIVTLPGQFMRGRHTTAILRRIGCEATIADSPEHYVAIAARLGVDPAWRGQVRRAVAARKHLAFRDLAPIRALETFFQSAVTAPGASPTG